MTSLSNEEVCRKSSVYNQTGQSYFQQLTAYNHMSAHLRRLVLASSVVDARNKKYALERDKRQQRIGWTCPCRSKNRRNLIEGLVYDTKHHPIDVLRMNFKCTPGCRFKDSRASTRASNARKIQGQRRDQGRRERDANKSGRGSSVEHSQTRGSQTPTSNAELSYNCYETHDYSDSEFDSPVDDSEIVDLPPQKDDSNKQSGKNERQVEEAKYAKFIYDITQEIMINGLYTDEELQAIFNKHIHMNSNVLDTDRMQMEIDQLRASLNLTQISDDEDEDIERFVASGKFANFSPNKPPTPPKVLDRNKFADKIREESTRFDEIRRKSGDSHAGKRNSVVLVDANPELLVTERDLLVTLMEMKLDPQQVHNIRKSLRNKSRDCNALAKTVDCVETFLSRHKQRDRAISPIIWKSEKRSTQFSETRVNDNRREESTGTAERRGRTESRKAPYCQCQCRQDVHNTTDNFYERQDIKTASKDERELQNEPAGSYDITSMKAEYIDNSLPDISERSEGTAGGDADETVTESSGELRQNSTLYKKLERQSANIENLESLSDSSSQIDEAQVVQELMELSEAEQVKDLKEKLSKSEISVKIENWDSSPINDDNSIHFNDESLIIRDDELNEPVSITEDITIVTASIDENRLNTEKSESAQTIDSESSKNKTQTYVVESVLTAAKQEEVIVVANEKEQNETLKMNSTRSGNESSLPENLIKEKEHPRANLKTAAELLTTTDSDISLANKEAPDDSLEISSGIPLINVPYEELASPRKFSSANLNTSTINTNIKTASSNEISLPQKSSSLTRKISTAVKNLRDRSNRRKNGNCRSDCRGFLSPRETSKVQSNRKDQIARALNFIGSETNSEDSD